jgi:hypothetical protein
VKVQAGGWRSTGAPIARYYLDHMPLSRSERFKLKGRLLDELSQDGSGWDLRRQNLLLSEFGLETVDGDRNGPMFEDVIARISDGDLIEMYSVVTGVAESEIVDGMDALDSGNWKSGYVRLFLSHSAVHKQFVGEIADELAVVGIHGFVAHDSMQVSKPWQAQIEHALRSMEAFVVLVHPEVNGSAWCQQEVGWALGRRVPIHVIRIGSDPTGFVGRDQWPSAVSMKAKGVAGMITSWVSALPDLGQTMVEGLFRALEESNNYIDAGATAQRIALLGDLNDEQWGQLSEIYWGNNQLYTGALPSKALRPFFENAGREWPPPKPDLLGVRTDPSLAPAGAPGDAPF